MIVKPEFEPPTVVEPARSADASVIWLHGLGADGHDFEPIVPELESAARATVRFVFPHAPEQPVTINGGMVMRAWYDIRHSDLNLEPDAAGVAASAAMLDGLVEDEMGRGIESRRIVLAGFSQGGAVALHTGLRQRPPLAGIMALSTYVPLETAVPERANAQPPPIFMAHGSQDPLIPLATSERSQALLMSRGYEVERHTYPMAHSVCAEQIRDISNWLIRRLKTEGKE